MIWGYRTNFVPADLVVSDGRPRPTLEKSMRLPDAPLRKIWAVPSAALLARVETSCPVRVPPARGSFVESATVMSELPLKATPLIALEVWSAVAVLAFPVRAPEKLVAVSVPAPLRVAASVAPPYHLNWAVELGADAQSVFASAPWP